MYKKILLLSILIQLFLIISCKKDETERHNVLVFELIDDSVYIQRGTYSVVKDY